MYVSTFYSYKGGVGRTMALVNVAYELANDGNRVLLVDFDLEAPGIKSYGFEDPRAEQFGLIDYVNQYQNNLTAPDLDPYIYESPNPQGKPIWIMPAGRNDSGYGRRLHSIDWKSLYEKGEGYLLFENLRAQGNDRLGADYVLIDSRTGYTDVGGICTRQLPDCVVFLFFPNDQNLDGLRRIIAAMDQERMEPNKRSISRVFVPANVPNIDDEKQILERRLLQFQDDLECKFRGLSIHHYESLDLLDQKIFSTDRPRTSLAREYRELSDAIRLRNPQDPEGALKFLKGFSSPHEFSTRTMAPIDVLESHIEEIESNHPENGEILFELGNVRNEQGKFEDAYLHFERSRQKGYDHQILNLSMASNLLILGRTDEANAELLSLLQRDDAHSEAVAFAVRRLKSADICLLELLPEAPALNNLTVDEKASIAGELFESSEGLEIAVRIYSRIVEEEYTDTPPDAIRNPFVLALIGTRKFEKASALIEDFSVDIMNLPIRDVFNHAMAEWCISGKPPREQFGRVVELDQKSSEKKSGSNYEQCLALAHWAVEEYSAATERLNTARELNRKSSRIEFSAWRYLEVGEIEFESDLDQIEALIDGKDLLPRMVVSK